MALKRRFHSVLIGSGLIIKHQFKLNSGKKEFVIFSVSKSVPERFDITRDTIT